MEMVPGGAAALPGQEAPVSPASRGHTFLACWFLKGRWSSEAPRKAEISAKCWGESWDILALLMAASSSGVGGDIPKALKGTGAVPALTLPQAWKLWIWNPGEGRHNPAVQTWQCHRKCPPGLVRAAQPGGFGWPRSSLAGLVQPRCPERQQSAEPFAQGQSKKRG